MSDNNPFEPIETTLSNPIHHKTCMAGNALAHWLAVC